MFLGTDIGTPRVYIGTYLLKRNIRNCALTGGVPISLFGVPISFSRVFHVKHCLSYSHFSTWHVTFYQLSFIFLIQVEISELGHSRCFSKFWLNKWCWHWKLSPLFFKSMIWQYCVTISPSLRKLLRKG